MKWTGFEDHWPLLNRISPTASAFLSWFPNPSCSSVPLRLTQTFTHFSENCVSHYAGINTHRHSFWFHYRRCNPFHRSSRSRPPYSRTSLFRTLLGLHTRSHLKATRVDMKMNKLENKIVIKYFTEIVFVFRYTVSTGFFLTGWALVHLLIFGVVTVN